MWTILKRTSLKCIVVSIAVAKRKQLFIGTVHVYTLYNAISISCHHTHLFIVHFYTIMIHRALTLVNGWDAHRHGNGLVTVVTSTQMVMDTK